MISSIRDIVLSTPSLGITVAEWFRRGGGPVINILSTPSLGITAFEQEFLYQPSYQLRAFNSLSRDHLLTYLSVPIADLGAFNSLSRDHRAESVKGIISAATNAWFAKNGAQALELLSQAKSEVQALDSLIDENKEILEKFGYYVSFKDQVRAIMNVISANEKAWTGQNPNRDLVNATTNYTNSTRSFNRTTAKNLKRLGPADPADPNIQHVLRKAFKIDTNNVAVGMLLAQLAQQLLQYIPRVELPLSTPSLGITGVGVRGSDHGAVLSTPSLGITTLRLFCRGL